MKYVWKGFLILLVVLFFPLSLVFVAYYRQRRSFREYGKDEK